MSKTVRLLALACAAVVLTVLLSLLPGCGCGGGLASLKGGPTGDFAVQSGQFTLNAGDTILIAYSVMPADSNFGDSAISVAMVASDGSTQNIVTTSGHSVDGLTWTIKKGDTYQLVADGTNMVYDVEVTQQ